MKCPVCGQWNRASFPVCVKCGAALTAEEARQEPSWRAALRDDKRGSAYIRVNEEGEAEATPDERDTLAQEMSDLKNRKAKGRELQRRLRAESAERGSAPSGMTVQTRGRTDRFWEGADTPVRMIGKPIRRVEQAREIDEGEPPEYEAVWNDPEFTAQWQLPQITTTGKLDVRIPSRRRSMRHLMRALIIILIVGLAGVAGYFGWQYYRIREDSRKQESAAIITATIKDDLAAHQIMIPGEDGTQIYIRELRTSYLVTDGFATVEIPDHTWYDEEADDNLGETMMVTLTPFLKTATGRQQPMDPIVYDIDIPLSPITLTQPDSTRIEVSTQMYTMKFELRPGSKVTINDKDCSDTVDSVDGTMAYNATVQPKGDNVYEVTVRSQYCRPNHMTIVLYRTPQEIPLDLAADTYGTTNKSSMKVNCTTVPGAYVDVLTPYSDMDISNIDTTGEFSFYAQFDHIGYNMITITSSVSGKKTSTVNYEVYYLPSADEYTTKAWSLNEAGYSELVGNIQVRVERTQVYVMTGTIVEVISDKPQIVKMFCDDSEDRPVAIQNFTNKNWKIGQKLRIFGDAYGAYNSWPLIAGRYSYPAD